MSPRCDNCGSWVSKDYVRVRSRDGETVHCCPADGCERTRDRNNEVRHSRYQHGAGPGGEA